MHSIQRIAIIVNHLKATKLRDVSLLKISPRGVTFTIVVLHHTHMFVRILRATALVTVLRAWFYEFCVFIGDDG